MVKLALLALSGSLRTESYNSAAIGALEELSPDHIEITVGDVGMLPIFNPDLEHTKIASVEQLKDSLARSDGLVIASPEYAHGISGPMKNALDWLVSGDEFPGKRVMLINTSPRAIHAEQALREVIRTMSGIVVERAYVSIPLLGSNLNKSGIIQNTDLASALRAGLIEFCESINNHKGDDNG